MANTQTLIERSTMISDCAKVLEQGKKKGGGGQPLCLRILAMTQVLGEVFTKFVVVHEQLCVIQGRLVIKGLASTV